MEQLTEAESVLLKAVWSSVIEPNKHYIADNVYEYLMRSEEAQIILRKYKTATFKLAFEAWLSGIFYCEQENNSYLEEFETIGKRLPITVLFSSFIFIRSMFNYLISKEFDKENKYIATKFNQIVNKILDLNLITIIKDHTK